MWKWNWGGLEASCAYAWMCQAFMFFPREQGGKEMSSPGFMYRIWQLILLLFVSEQNCAIETLKYEKYCDRSHCILFSLWHFPPCKEHRHYQNVLVFDVHVTVLHDKFLIIKPTRCTNFSNLFLEWNSTCFRQFLCPSSGVFHCTHSKPV